MSGDENAFPSETYLERDDRSLTFKVMNAGLTKRELFAAMAMQGMLSTPHPEVFREMVKLGGESFGSVISKVSIEAADTLIAELEKK